MGNYAKYKEFLQQIEDINHAAAVLNWDQEVFMPEKGAEQRAKQLATLAGISHELSTKKEFEAILMALENDKTLSEEEQANVRETLISFKRNKKYSVEFVQELSRNISEAFNAWHKAKNEDNFELFAPQLEKLVELKRKECELLGYEDHPYDALLDLYEPGLTVKELDVLFDDVKNQLVDFVKEIAGAPQNDDAIMYQHYPKDKQIEFTEFLLEQMGYDFKAGRQDISTHPFTTCFGPADVRVTTRVNENDLSEILWSSIHEGGHAVYEQGLKNENYGLPAGSYLSLGIHESQSRLYENNVGRSLNYWKFNFEKLKELFPENLEKYTAEDFYKAMNIVKPSFIRTNADELTYHFHVLIRYEIEKELIARNIEVKYLPEFWNSKYKAYLNIDVPSDQQGVLQDIHWSHGSFGYFPTYSLGSFYAAQFFEQAKKEIPNLENQIANGELNELLDWLRDKIHQHGRLFEAGELCERITGEKLNFKYFMNYARKKYEHLYNLKPVSI